MGCTRAHTWWVASVLPLHKLGRHVCKRGEGREGWRDTYEHGSPPWVCVAVCLAKCSTSHPCRPPLLLKSYSQAPSTLWMLWCEPCAPLARGLSPWHVLRACQVTGGWQLASLVCAISLTPCLAPCLCHCRQPGGCLGQPVGVCGV